MEISLSFYLKSISKIPYGSTIEQYYVALYDHESLLSDYVSWLTIYTEILEKSVKLLNEHFETFIKEEQAEGLQCLLWRLELEKTAKDARKKLDYYQWINEGREIEMPIFEAPILTVKNPYTHPDHSTMLLINLPVVSKKEKERRKKLKYKQCKREEIKWKELNETIEADLLDYSMDSFHLSSFYLFYPEKLPNFDISDEFLEELVKIAIEKCDEDKSFYLDLNILLLNKKYHKKVYNILLEGKGNIWYSHIAPLLDYQTLAQLNKYHDDANKIVRYIIHYGERILLFNFFIQEILKTKIDIITLYKYMIEKLKLLKFKYETEFINLLNNYPSINKKLKFACLKLFDSFINFTSLLIETKLYDSRMDLKNILIFTAVTRSVTKGGFAQNPVHDYFVKHGYNNGYKIKSWTDDDM